MKPYLSASCRSWNTMRAPRLFVCVAVAAAVASPASAQPIERISAATIPTDRSATTVVIDGGGRTLMPGLIDQHWHTMLVRPTPAAAIANAEGYTNLVAGDEATDTLMRGFTTVRDVGGPAWSLKRAIDEGIVDGPRIYPSGAMISVTSGHGDFRMPFDVPRSPGAPLTRAELLGGSAIADSPDEVRLRVREQLMLGASQIKLTAGGGVASPDSPLDAVTFTEAELRAAVEAVYEEVLGLRQVVDHPCGGVESEPRQGGFVRCSPPCS
jgi:imidazolonepropionase-like amidohydrolase